MILGVFVGLIIIAITCSKTHQTYEEKVKEIAAEPTSPKITIKPSRGVVIDAHTHINANAIPKTIQAMDDSGIAGLVNLSGGSGIGFDLNVQAFHPVRDRMVLAANLDWRWLMEPQRFGEANAALLREQVARGAVALKIYKALGLYYPNPETNPMRRYFDELRGREGITWDDPQKPGDLLRIDTPLLDPVWETCAELNIPVYIHVGDPKAFFQPPTPDNERYEELGEHPNWSFSGPQYPSWQELLQQFEHILLRHPDTVFIGVHFGNAAEEPERVARMLETYPNLYIDIAARIPEFGRHNAKLIRKFFVTYQDRILFGTDFSVSTRNYMLGSPDGTVKTRDDAKRYFKDHWAYLETDAKQIDNPTPIQGRWKIDAINLPPDVLQKIYSTNALKLFPSLKHLHTGQR